MMMREHAWGRMFIRVTCILTPSTGMIHSWPPIGKIAGISMIWTSMQHACPSMPPVIAIDIFFC
jgi:hypothetical protein